MGISNWSLKQFHLFIRSYINYEKQAKKTYPSIMNLGLQKFVVSKLCMPHFKKVSDPGGSLQPVFFIFVMNECVLSVFTGNLMICFQETFFEKYGPFFSHYFSL